MTDSTVKSSGMGFCGALGIVFIALKLLHAIAWSWWWVLAPLWGPPVLIGLIAVLSLVVIFLIAAMTGWKG